MIDENGVVQLDPDPLLEQLMNADYVGLEPVTCLGNPGRAGRGDKLVMKVYRRGDDHRWTRVHPLGQRGSHWKEGDLLQIGDVGPADFASNCEACGVCLGFHGVFSQGVYVGIYRDECSCWVEKEES